MKAQLEPRLLTVREAARYLSVSQTSIRQWVRDGLLPRVHLAGCVRLDRADLDAWIDRSRTQRLMD